MILKVRRRAVNGFLQWLYIDKITQLWCKEGFIKTEPSDLGTIFKAFVGIPGRCDLKDVAEIVIDDSTKVSEDKIGTLKATILDCKRVEYDDISLCLVGVYGFLMNDEGKTIERL